jgi:hypothetical protein
VKLGLGVVRKYRPELPLSLILISARYFKFLYGPLVDTSIEALPDPQRASTGWGFADHVGYSTPEHRDAIQRLGVSPLHRMSFQSIAYQQLAIEG